MMVSTSYVTIEQYYIELFAHSSKHHMIENLVKKIDIKVHGLGQFIRYVSDRVYHQQLKLT